MHLHPLNNDRYISISNKLFTVLCLVQKYLEIKIQEEEQQQDS